MGKILLADDEPVVRKLFGIYFGRAFPNREVETFVDGTELSERLDKGVEGVDLIWTDNTMPGMSGREIAQRYSGIGVPIIICSGDLSEEEARDAGAFGYVPKPANRDQVVDAARSALDYSESLNNSRGSD